MFLLAKPAMASHIVGGDIYYDYLGNNNYRFVITIYRDCFSTGAAYDNPLYLGVYLANNSLLQTVAVPFPGSVVLPVVFNNPCVIPPTDICIERAIYTTIINLPPTPGGYTISYQRCCRGPNITNLNAPDDTGLTLTTHIPGSETGFVINSSPRFTNYPPLLLCNNDELIFDHSATDPDGDQLVYSLVAPFAGATSGLPAPNPPPPPVYFPVSWAGGFSTANPLGPGASININPVTGLLTASPEMIGLFVVGVRVQEYRNGVLVGETVRDFLFRVFNCTITMQAILPVQEDLATFVSYCQGLTVQFENNSYGGTNYQWDFGVNGITSDVSSNFAPTYTYPQSGIYNAMLIVNPGWPCTDTAYMEVNVNNLLSISYTSEDSLCILNNSVDFAGATDGPASTTFSWNFGPNASITSATSLNVNNVSFTQSGFNVVTLSASNGTCENIYTDSIYIFDMPMASIDLPVGYECEGLTIPFGNNSTGTFNYLWDFGVGGTNTDVSNAFEPSFTFPAGGTYDITLIGSSSAACVDTTQTSITVYDLLTVAFTSNDSLCITDNVFNFDGQMTGPSITQFSWDFGPNANISSATTLDVNGVVFNTNGYIPVTLTGSFNSCLESYIDSVFIFQEPTIDFTVLDGPRCAPAEVQFVDQSQADTPIFYSWNFGDGGTSSSSDPSNVYVNPGTYSVGLQIYTTSGCIDTLYMLQQDLVTIHPSPVSSFKVNPEKTDICHPEVTFTDQSQGATSIYYFFDDSSQFSFEPNVVYAYTQSGWMRPMQVATNEFGCRDTSYRNLYIEPFVIYAPNTFTPDGNEFNNEFNPVYAVETFEVYNWELRIFNRWGELIYVSTDPAFGWDGSYNGKLVQEGTYTWVLRYVSCENTDGWQEKRGSVTLLK
jgi:gliding motility-associated-like protein